MSHRRQFISTIIGKIIPLFILLLAFLLQMRYLAELRETFPDSLTRQPFCGVDAQAHVERASGLLDGSLPGDNTYYFIPLYPFYLALLKQFFGNTLLFPVIVQALLQIVGIAALYSIGRLIFSPLAGLLAALGLATYNYYIFYVPCFDQALLTVPFLTLAVFFLLVYHRRHKSRWLLLAGIMLAIAAVSRPTILAVFPLIIIWLYLNPKRGGNDEAKLFQNVRSFGKNIFLLIVPLVLVVAPITWHNYRVSGRFILLSDNFDVNIYTGNNPDAGGLDSLIQPQSQPAVLRFKELYPRVGNGETTLTAEVLRYITGQPGDWLTLMATKTWLWFGEIDERLVSPFFPLTISQSHTLALLPFEWQAIAIVALLGILLVPREVRSRQQIGLLWLVYGTLSVATILFFIQLRFRLPFLPFVLLSAASLLAIAPQWARYHPGRFWGTLIILLLLYPLVPTLWVFILLFAGLGLGTAELQTPSKTRKHRASVAKGAPESRRIVNLRSLLTLRSSLLTLHSSLFALRSSLFALRSSLLAPRSSLLAICLYLLVVGLWLKANAPDASQTIDHYLGPPLAVTGILGQTFQVDCDDLHRIEVTLGVFNHLHDQPVTFYLGTDPSTQEVLFSETFDGNSVRDYQQKNFSFPPIPDSAGRTFFFFIASPTSTPQNAITARGYTDTPVDRYPGGNGWAGQPGNLQRLQADFAFRAYCDLSLWQKIWGVLEGL